MTSTEGRQQILIRMNEKRAAHLFLSLQKKGELRALLQLFKIGGYLIYFWVQEGVPLEPVHVYISVSRPNKDSTTALCCSSESMSAFPSPFWNP